MTGNEYAAAAIDARPASIAEYNAFKAMINEINRQERRARALPAPLMLVPALNEGAVIALHAMLMEPERAWSTANNVRLANGRTFGELVTIVAPELDGTIPNRVTFFTALGRAVEEAQHMPTRSKNSARE